jgi:hypothetical protein
MVVASERPVIQTAFNVNADDIVELNPGQALMMSKNGAIRLAQINTPQLRKSCSFERYILVAEVIRTFIEKESSWARNWSLLF